MTTRIEALDTFYGSPAEGVVKPGQQWDTTESRAQELLKRGLVKVVEPEKEEAKPKPKPGADRETKPAGPKETK